MTLTKKIAIIVGCIIAALIFAFTVFSTIKMYINDFVEGKMQIVREETTKLISDNLVQQLSQDGKLVITIKNNDGKFEKFTLTPDRPLTAPSTITNAEQPATP